jgi:hypothetical protein
MVDAESGAMNRQVRDGLTSGTGLKCHGHLLYLDIQLGDWGRGRNSNIPSDGLEDLGVSDCGSSGKHGTKSAVLLPVMVPGGAAGLPELVEETGAGMKEEAGRRR